MVLRREDIAGRPADIGAEFNQCFNQRGGLDRHVQTAHDPDSLQRFLPAVFFARSHKPGHFLFRNVEFLASECSKRNILHLVVGSRYFFCLGGSLCFCHESVNPYLQHIVF